MSDEGNAIMDCNTHDLVKLQTKRKKLEHEYVVIHSKIRQVDFEIDQILDKQVIDERTK